ncbi:MAG: restriction endonuclease [Deltaproteobacteria bacterium HGW-Deltaproteobacteria-18]|jgi:type I restriction enzyme S subunit|nr:MAG: restriction endonuclease [Deltaproteobacteria bacterium HGW-Deltaproteobacteria-18]
MNNVSLGDYMVSRGGSVDPKKFSDEAFELFSIPAYDQYSPEILFGSEIGSSKKVVQENDVLLSRIVPHIRRVWIVGPANSTRQIASSEWIIFRGKDFFPQYLRHVLLSDVFHHSFMQTVAGIGGSLLRARPQSVAEIKIPLPPLPEQKRIAAILDQVDTIRRKRQDAIALADTFLRSVFLKMFGDPVTNSMGWDEVLLKNVASIGSGVTKGKKYKELKLVEVPYMRVANVQDGWIDTSDMKSISVSPTDVARFSIKKGDLLLTEGGDPDKLGRGAVWDGSISPCIHQNHIFKVRFDTSFVLPEYASFLIGSIRGKRYFLCAAKQTTGIATINKTQLSNFKMLVPDMKLQQQFSDTVLRAKVTWKKLEQLADVSNNIFSSLQQRAFRGDL